MVDRCFSNASSALNVTEDSACRAESSVGTDRIVLNVGGKIFHSTKQTILSFPNSLFGTPQFVADEKGEYFVDRDPKVFEMILKFLRSKGQLKPLEEIGRLNQVTKDEMIMEAKHFRLKDMLLQLGVTEEFDATKDLGSTKKRKITETPQTSETSETSESGKINEIEPTEIQRTTGSSPLEVEETLKKSRKVENDPKSSARLPNARVTRLSLPKGSASHSESEGSDLSNRTIPDSCTSRGANQIETNVLNMDPALVILSQEKEQKEKHEEKVEDEDEWTTAGKSTNVNDNESDMEKAKSKSKTKSKSENKNKQQAQRNSTQSNDTCDVCDTGGMLICCDGCPAAFHLTCIGLTKTPKNDWFCNTCKMEKCGHCRKGKLKMNDHVICGNEDETMGCDRLFHLKCVNLVRVPKEDWFCKKCLVKYA